MITKAPRLLFLGAGASYPLGKLLMGPFMDKFRKKTNNELLEALCEKKSDLEFVLEQAEDIASKAYLAASQFNPDAILGGAPYPKVRWPEIAEVAGLARDLLDDLKRDVYVHYRDIPTPGRLTSLYTDLFKTLFEDRRPSVVFTTNYDPAMEDFCRQSNLDLVDGFVHDAQNHEYIWKRSGFDETYALTNALVLFKLHGSTNWIRSDKKIVKAPPVYGIDSAYEHALIYPATRKVAINEPFFTAYDYLEKCLSNAECCLVIGYSFRDYDTLMRFKAAAISNKNLRILILDPRANELAKELNQHGISPIPIAKTFGLQEEDYLQLLKQHLAVPTNV